MFKRTFIQRVISLVIHLYTLLMPSELANPPQRLSDAAMPNGYPMLPCPTVVTDAPTALIDFASHTVYMQLNQDQE